MKTEITVNPKTMAATILFKVEDFTKEADYKNALAILSMVAGDYHLDPEVEVEELQGFVQQAKNEAKMALEFIVDEEGLELELLNI